MAESIAKGVVCSGVLPPSRIQTAHSNPVRIKAFDSFGVKVLSRNDEVVDESDVIIFSVKPQVVKDVLLQLRPKLWKKKLLVSVAAGVKLKDLQECAGNSGFVRVMPNTPAAVGNAASGLCAMGIKYFRAENHCLWSLNNVAVVVQAMFILLQVCSQHAVAGEPVKFLPGFQGPLPFELETGYVGVGDSDEVQLYYHFIKSEGNPKEDPLILWLTGGPGCSGLSGLMFEIGPIAFKNEEYTGGVPNLVLRSHSWTKVSSIIFIDSPVGTGFSYAVNQTLSQFLSDKKQVNHVYKFLQKWLTDIYPEFLSNPLYIGGESYAGIIVAVLAQEISDGNERGLHPKMNLQGYILGNPCTDGTEDNYKVPFAHGMALIPDELYESLKENCKGLYMLNNESSGLCRRDMQTFNELISGIPLNHILDAKCEYNSPRPREVPSTRYISKKLELVPFHPRLSLPPLGCRTYANFMSIYWVNSEDVQTALHVRKGTVGVGEWKRCSTYIPIKYEGDVLNSLPYLANLSRKGYRSLVYSGDHDMMVCFLATQAWIKSLNYSIIDKWRPWFLQGQVAGFTRTYSNRMTYATVKGAGHTAPEFNPKECLAMVGRWLSGNPL